MQAKRVLIQWLPTLMLRDERYLTLGSSWTGEVQQKGIEWHDPRFPLAIALAAKQGRKHNGFPVLQVGFTCSTRYTNEGWVLDGPSTAGWKEWAAEPSYQELLDAELEAQGGLTAELEERIARMEAIIDHLRAQHAAQAVAEAERIRERTQADAAAIDESKTMRMAPSDASGGPGERPKATDVSGPV